jgi:hypothetical protein
VTEPPIESTTSMPERSRWQFSLRRMFVATTAIAILLSLASWGGWVRSDAVVYLSILVLGGVFSAATRRAILGACSIVAALWLAVVFGQIAFGPASGRLGVNPESLWIFALLLVAAATLLRLYTRTSAWPLMASLILIEMLIAAVVIYTYGCPTLFQAFSPDNRRYVLIHFRGNFPIVQQLFIVMPWLFGIVLGEVLTRRRKSGHDQS